MSYRSMYLLNVQEKIIEKFINARLKYCRMDAINHIVDKIKRETIYILKFFVDFSGAFDRMSWPRLFSLLRSLQILIP